MSAVKHRSHLHAGNLRHRTRGVRQTKLFPVGSLFFLSHSVEIPGRYVPTGVVYGNKDETRNKKIKDRHRYRRYVPGYLAGARPAAFELPRSGMLGAEFSERAFPSGSARGTPARRPARAQQRPAPPGHYRATKTTEAPPRRHKEGLGPLQRPLLRSEWVPIHRPNCDAGLRGVRRTSNHQP